MGKYKIFILSTSVVTILLGLFVSCLYVIIENKLFNSHTMPLPMAIGSAICFIYLGTALLLSLLPKWRSFHTVCLVMIICCCITALLPHFTAVSFPVNFGMSPLTSFTFICISAAMLQLSYKRNIFYAQIVLHVATLLSFIVIIGHILQIPEFYRFTFVPMSVYAAVAFLAVSIAVSLLNPNVGITAIFTGNEIGHYMARKLFLWMLIAIFFAGWLRLLTHRKNIIGVELGIAIYAVSFCLISLLLISIVSKLLNKTNAKANMATENFRQMVQAAPYALVMTDINGIILETNRHSEILFGYAKAELIGHKASSLVPHSLKAFWKEQRMAFFANPAIKTYGIDEDFYALRKDGKTFPIEAVLTPVVTEHGNRILAFILDITERKNHEKIIKEQVRELQQKTQELEQFNYISSHDLQEPLRTVANYVSMLQEDYPQQVTGEVKEHLIAINNAVTRMGALVRSLLEFGKLGRDRKMTKVNTRALVKEVIEDLAGLIKVNNALIAIEGEFPTVYAYETELRQLFQNLINNAVKFKADGMQPKVTITCKTVDGYYKFEVADNGIGIPNEHLSKIFNIFQRLNKSEKYEGYGIGLANCKKIAEIHGGMIWVKSTVGIGSTFIFTILNLKHDSNPQLHNAH